MNPLSNHIEIEHFAGFWTGEYRYGFNGMEKDGEVKGSGNSLDFGARIYDSRVGRLSVDPLAAKYPSMSPYSYVGNSPLYFVDPDGERLVAYTKQQRKDKRAYIKMMKQTSVGRQILRANRRSEQNIVIEYTNNVIIQTGQQGKWIGMAEGYTSNGHFTDDGEEYTKILISTAPQAMWLYIKQQSGRGRESFDFQNPVDVNQVNNLKQQYFTQNPTNAVDERGNLLNGQVNGVNVPQSFVWSDAQIIQNYGSKKLYLDSKPLSNETLAEYLERLSVHEGTHPNTVDVNTEMREKLLDDPNSPPSDYHDVLENRGIPSYKNQRTIKENQKSRRKVVEHQNKLNN